MARKCRHGTIAVVDHTEFLLARLGESDPGSPATELERLIADLHVGSPSSGARWCEECGAAWPCPRLLAVSRGYAHHPDFPGTWAS